jgi:hypothetical protein
MNTKPIYKATPPQFQTLIEYWDYLQWIQEHNDHVSELSSEWAWSGEFEPLPYFTARAFIKLHNVNIQCDYTEYYVERPPFEMDIPF